MLKRATYKWMKLYVNLKCGDSVNNKNGNNFMGLWDGIPLQTNGVEFSISTSAGLKLCLFSKLEQTKGKINKTTIS